MRRVRIDTSQLVARHHSGWRRARFLPFLLFALVVSTLVLITLSHIAVIHRVSFSQQLLSYPASGGVVPLGTRRHPSNRTGAAKSGAAAGNAKSRPTGSGGKSIRLEPLLSRNVVPVEVNALLLRHALNEKKMRDLLERADKPEVNDPADRVKGYSEFGNASTPPSQWTAVETNESLTGNWTMPIRMCQLMPLLPYCPEVPPQLDGPLFPENHNHDAFDKMEEVVRSNSDVCPGGWWRPEACAARHRVAVIIPYRDRKEHLTTLLSHLHPILKKQQLDYKIYVAEQLGNATFNKGILMNAAFVMSMREADYHCYVFHDVDLIPEDDRNMYSCPDHPRHMSVAVDEFQYKLPYTFLVGGVFSIRANHFLKVNGYSNMYWGWGGEDDDMSARIVHSGLVIVRPSSAIARYRMIKHVKRKPLVWKIRGKLLSTAKRRMRFDGLNTLNYTLISTTISALYTNFTIDVGTNPFPSDIS